jgi:hypothetical protein
MIMRHGLSVVQQCIIVLGDRYTEDSLYPCGYSELLV